MDYLIQGVVCYYDVRISNLLIVNRMCYLALHTRHCERSFFLALLDVWEAPRWRDACTYWLSWWQVKNCWAY